MTDDRPPADPAVLREQWRRATMASGWAFASDWFDDAINHVCESVATRAAPDASDAAKHLGLVRAKAGVSLAETLADLDVLVRLSGTRFAHDVLRSASIGWEQGIQPVPTAMIDPMTGLAEPDYMKIRLMEIYRAGADDHVLVTLRIDADRPGRYGLELALILVADAVMQTFERCSQPTRIGRSTVVCLCPADGDPLRSAWAAAAIANTGIGTVPKARVHKLPGTYDAAVRLLFRISRG